MKRTTELKTILKHETKNVDLKETEHVNVKSHLNGNVTSKLTWGLKRNPKQQQIKKLKNEIKKGNLNSELK